MGGYQGKVYNTPEEAEEFVNSTIAAHPVVMFTKRFSPFCFKARSAFKSINVPCEEILLSGRPDCQTIQDALQKMTGARTVPRVFIHQKCIGGGDETSALQKEGKLKALVDNKEEEKDVEQKADETAPKADETTPEQSPSEEAKQEAAETEPKQDVSEPPAEEQAAAPTEDAAQQKEDEKSE